MLQISNILVPYDFSQYSKQALISALNLAQLTKAALHVVHIGVIPGLLPLDVPPEPDRTETFKKRFIEENADLKPMLDGVSIAYFVDIDIAAGPPILRYAKRKNIDLIIAGTHGREGIKRVFLGSVAEEIVRHSLCPVITVGGDEHSNVRLDKIKRMLVPIDFSKHSEQALIHAKELATLSGAQIDMLHVVNVPSYPTLNDTGLFSIYRYNPDVEPKALKSLKALYNRSGGPETRVTFNTLHGQPANAIIQFATEEKSDLIVMGTHGLTGLSHFFLGSEAAKTIRRAPCPMFIVKSFGKFLVDPTLQAQKEVI